MKILYSKKNGNGTGNNVFITKGIPHNFVTDAYDLDRHSITFQICDGVSHVVISLTFEEAAEIGRILIARGVR